MWLGKSSAYSVGDESSIGPELLPLLNYARLQTSIVLKFNLLVVLKRKLNWLYKNRILQHTLFWAFHVVFYATLYGSFTDNYDQTFVEELIFLPGRMLFTYFTLYFLLPRFLLPGKYSSFFIWFTVSWLIAGLFQRYISHSVQYPLYYPEYLSEELLWFPKVVKSAVSLIPITVSAVAIKLLKYWYANQQAQQILTEEKLNAELKFLKTQIHPHFLFNTLNNLYALTLKKSERAPEMVLKLSELINYMLYECKSDQVPLSKEVKFIQNYVDIEKMRYGEKLDVDMRVNGNVNDRTIAPLIILPFVENCFKHGASENLQQSWVKITIDSYADHVIVKVENSKSGKNGNGNEGIGIQNVKRRLALQYPGNHELKLINGEETFLVVLSINS
jgi:two-component system, LytTR family, sensor kinase